MQAEHLQFFANYIERELGIVYANTNYFQLQNRLDEIAKTMGLATADDLVTVARAGITGTFRQLLLDVATNNETSFFRDPKLFEAFKTEFLPKIINRVGGQPLRIWSAASSTGQEAYSLAIIMQELRTSGVDVKVDIIATDISQRALVKAAEAKFTQLEVQRGLSTALISKYFKPNSDQTFSLNPEVKSLVKFHQQNLCLPFQNLESFDVIFCRNVLIYQRLENKVKIVKRLSEKLKPGGLLIMGAGESLIGISQDFVQREFKNVIVYEAKALDLRAAA